MRDDTAKYNEARVIGQTKDAGFQIGVRRTLPLSSAAAWRLLTSPEGLALWLGETSIERFEPEVRYRLPNGTEGEIRVVVPNDRLRMTWQPPGWSRPSTIQIRLLPKGHSTTIAFHQEWLPDATAREERRAHYDAVLSELARLADT